MTTDRGLENLFPMHPDPQGGGLVPIVGSIILSAFINGIALAITATPLVLLLVVLL